MTDELSDSIGAGTTEPLAVERPDAVRSYWDERARLGERAGTRDLIAKTLEQRAILAELRGYSQYIAPPGVELTDFGGGRGFLEVGCGTGEMAREVASEFGSDRVWAVDQSSAMFDAAVSAPVPDNLEFSVANVLSLPVGRFHVVYSQRCLINLPTWEQQRQAIDAIADQLVSGGKFLMCENSHEGLAAINVERVRLGLEPIQAPWHNRYFRDSELATITSLTLQKTVYFSATYYYHSRVLNAALSEVPSYEARINKLALELPADCVNPKFAQGRVWVWTKE